MKETFSVETKISFSVLKAQINLIWMKNEASSLAKDDCGKDQMKVWEEEMLILSVSIWHVSLNRSFNSKIYIYENNFSEYTLFNIIWTQ